MKKKDYIFILLGTSLMALAVNVVYEPMNMVTGGVSGLAIVIKNLIGVPVWVTNGLINIPLLLAAIKIKGKKFFIKTLYATICFTTALGVIPTYPILEADYLLAVLIGGVISGVGLGLVFVTEGSTGGTDLFGAILHYFIPYYSVAQLLMVVDSVIVLVGAVVFGIQNALYAVMAVYITSKIMDGILEGLKFGKIAFIISEHSEIIAAEILGEMDRGVTALSAKGKYSNKEKEMLFCVVSKKEIVRLMDIVAKNDKRAFVIVTDAREVLGEGFVEYRQ